MSAFSCCHKSLQIQTQIATAQGSPGQSQQQDILELLIQDFCVFPSMVPNSSRLYWECFPRTWISEEFLLSGGRSHRAITGQKPFSFAKKLIPLYCNFHFQLDSWCSTQFFFWIPFLWELTCSIALTITSKLMTEGWGYCRVPSTVPGTK